MDLSLPMMAASRMSNLQATHQPLQILDLSMHTDPIQKKPVKPTMVAPNKLLLKLIVKLDRVNVLPGMVVQVKDYSSCPIQQTDDDVSTIPAVELTKSNVQENNNDGDSSDSTIIYSLASTPVLLVNDSTDKYKKPKYKLPPSLKTPATHEKAKFQV